MDRIGDKPSFQQPCLRRRGPAMKIEDNMTVGPVPGCPKGRGAPRQTQGCPPGGEGRSALDLAWSGGKKAKTPRSKLSTPLSAVLCPAAHRTEGISFPNKPGSVWLAIFSSQRTWVPDGGSCRPLPVVMAQRMEGRAQAPGDPRSRHPFPGAAFPNTHHGACPSVPWTPPLTAAAPAVPRWGRVVGWGEQSALSPERTRAFQRTGSYLHTHVNSSTLHNRQTAKW